MYLFQAFVVLAVFNMIRVRALAVVHMVAKALAETKHSMKRCMVSQTVDLYIM